MERPTLALCAIFCCCGLLGAEVSPAPSEETLFRLPLSDGREIAVVRAPAIDPSLLRELVSDAVFRQTAALYPIRAELRSPASPPQVFWTYLKREPTAASLKGFAVLDAAVAQNQLILATAEAGEILIWRIGLCGGSQAVLLRGTDWSPIAAIMPLDNNQVRAKLGFTADGKRLTVRVTDLRVQGHPQTVFEETGDGKAFRLAKNEPG